MLRHVEEHDELARDFRADFLRFVLGISEFSDARWCTAACIELYGDFAYRLASSESLGADMTAPSANLFGNIAQVYKIICYVNQFGRGI